MQQGPLRVYFGPDATVAATPIPEQPVEHEVTVTFGQIMPMLLDAVANNRSWLQDFEDEKLKVSEDLYDVLMAYRRFQRPSA